MKNYLNWIYFIIVFAVSFAVYIFTLTPGLTFTDSGELAAVCVTLGVSHPTGYPLFTIVGHLWSLLPLPFSKIYSLNLFAAFCTAMSSAVFFLIIHFILDMINKQVQPKESAINRKKAKEKKTYLKRVNTLNDISLLTLSAIGAFIYSFATTVWAQATSIEVYPLQLLIVMISLLMLLKAAFGNIDNKKYYFISAFMIGLGFANHMTTLFLLPPALYLLFSDPAKIFVNTNQKFKFLLWLLIPFFISLSLYIYLPVRSAMNPEFNWGDVSRSLNKLWYHITAKQYQVWMFSGPKSWNENFTKFFKVFPYEFGWIGILPLLAGFYIMLMRAKKILILMLLLAASCIFYSFNYSIHDIETYFITAYIALFVITAGGIYFLTTYISKFYPIWLIIPIMSIYLNYNDNDRSSDYLVSEYTRHVVDNLEPNSIIISAQWDYWCSAFWYLQQVEGYRKDVVLIEKELLRRTWFPKQLSNWYPDVMDRSKPELAAYMKDLERFEAAENYDPASIQYNFENLCNSFIDKNIGKRPVYMTIDVINSEKAVGAKYNKIPWGFAVKVSQDTSAKFFPVYKINTTKFIGSVKNSTGHLEVGIRQAASMNFTLLGRYGMVHKDLRQGGDSFVKALQIDPKNPDAQEGINVVNEIMKLQEKNPVGMIRQ